MAKPDFSKLAHETLTTFKEIAQTANEYLNSDTSPGDGGIVSHGKNFTGDGSDPQENLESIRSGERLAMKRLCGEPAIARLVIEDDDSNLRVIYISRTHNLTLPSSKELASYRSPMGRLAELPPGEEEIIVIGGRSKNYSVIENVSYQPTRKHEDWDSKPTQYDHLDHDICSIESLRALLKTEKIDGADELDQLLEDEKQGGVAKGIGHQIRTAMSLRDQPILDQFQGEIFRLPLNSQLMILGPPGTGKTTTLIKRLGQKLDFGSLDSDEKRLLRASNDQRPQQESWIMFTPSELLKHYLKEAFSREQVPASDAHIRTWDSFCKDIARNTLGVLRTANGGRFDLKPDQLNVIPAIVEDSSGWYSAFQNFHEDRLRQQLLDGLDIVSKAASDTEHGVYQSLNTLSDNLKSGSLIDVYRALEDKGGLKQALTDSKAIADEMLRKERNFLYNSNKEVFRQLADYLDSIKQENENETEDDDDEGGFDEDEQEESSAPRHSSIQSGVTAYLSAIKTLARTRYQKRSLSKTSRSAAVIEFLGEAVPNKEVLKEIGRHISFQNGLRRFINSHRRLVTEIPSSYKKFRKDKSQIAAFYSTDDINSAHLSKIELDLVVLLMLKSARNLLSQPFVARSTSDVRFNYLVNIAELFRNQVMVDEATDFSMLELACMANLTSLQSQSFFACGDFNQRITTTGVRQRQQLEWVLSSLEIRTVQHVYRQSKKLNAFAEELLRIQEGDLSALGKVPKESIHEGVNPVLFEGAGSADYEKGIRWIAERIKEVERSVQQLPTIAVLVNADEEAKSTAEQLSKHLEEVNLEAVAFEKGSALGENTDVRVFSIEHIKGLEFEAVFFAAIDRLAQVKPDLFERYLYVGVTRAATYLGLMCEGQLPKKLEPVRNSFVSEWDV